MIESIRTDSKRQQILNLLFFCLMTACFFTCTFLTSSVCILHFLGVIVTIGLLNYTNKSAQERRDSLTIFLITLTAGLLLALANYIGYVKNGVPFLYPDQMHFYEQAQIVASQSSILSCIIYASQNYIEYYFVYALNGVLGYIDRLFSGNVHFLPLLFSVAYLTALIPVFFYHTLKLYIPNRAALRGSLYFALATPIMAYSGFLLRDIHLSLVFSIVLFWIVREVSIPRILGILLMFPIVAGLRVANIFLLMAMLLIYIFAGKTSKVVRFFCIISIIIGGLYYVSEVSSTLLSTQSRLEHYQEFTTEVVDSTEGLGKKIHNLPPVIKETAIVLNGLIAFPFWGKITSNLDAQEVVITSYNTITNIGWFFILMGLLYFVKPLWSLLRAKKNRLLLYLFLLSFLYVIGNVSNMATRRIMCVYPFITLPFMIVYQHQSKEKRKKHVIFTMSLILSLTLAYTFLLF